ncbi:FecR family protein [uncultured Arcobacter sp.]|uniref:FecR family protein n=1 Tax=uncultured Arcobacter sp. TaxID=165434 RepID=UPI0026366A59|nr:FecR family protein [uncultured Arcobacter sp.]
MKKILLLLFILTNFLFASVGQITALVGDVKISRDSNTILAKLGEKLEKNDVINSAKASKAQVTLDDNTIITIGQNSTLNIFDYAYDETKPNDSKADIGFMKGSFKSITGKIGKINKERFKLKTKSASIGIRGTTIIGNQRIIACTDGAISVTANGVTVNVEKQELTRTPQGEAPTPPEPLKQDTLDNIEQQDGGGNNDNTPPEAPKVIDDAPPSNPPKPDIPTTSPIKKEHSTLSNFSTLGYVNTIIYDSNEDFESFKNGEIGMNDFDSSSTSITSSSLKMKIFDNDITNATLSNEDYFYDQLTDSNYLVWGEWSKNGNSGGWIAGTKTAKSIVDSVINGLNDTVNFYGNVIHGNIYDGTHKYSILNSSEVDFAFDFGGGSGSFTGSMNLIYTNNSQQTITYGIDIGNNGVVNSSGFSSSDLTHNSNSITGNVNGSFYGEGSIKAIGGKFDFEDGVIKGSGLFKAIEGTRPPP